MPVTRSRKPSTDASASRQRDDVERRQVVRDVGLNLHEAVVHTEPGAALYDREHGRSFGYDRCGRRTV